MRTTETIFDAEHENETCLVGEVLNHRRSETQNGVKMLTVRLGVGVPRHVRVTIHAYGRYGDVGLHRGDLVKVRGALVSWRRRGEWLYAVKAEHPIEVLRRSLDDEVAS